MFVIRPVDNKDIQEELCGACQCAYLAEDFACRWQSHVEFLADGICVALP